MRNCILLLLFLSAHCGNAQLKGNSLNDYLHNVKILAGAKDSLYNTILDNYEAHLRRKPGDVFVHIEKCRFIENAYIEDEYNPKYDEFMACADTLLKRFPENPDVLLFRIESMYSDSAREFLLHVVNLKESNPDVWQGKPFWKVYVRLAQIYDEDENTNQSLEYADKAIQENDSLDLTVLIANQYIREKLKTKAKEVLISKINEHNSAWDLNQKGKMLLELNAPEEALKAFHLAKKDTSGWINESDLAKALIENGLPSEARVYLVKATEPAWTRPETLIRLLEYDLEYSSGDSASTTYRKLVAEDFWYDPIGVYRARLFLSAPLAGWTFGDLVRIGILILCLVTIVVLPYTWILPVHFFGMKLHFNRHNDLALSHDLWNLRDFWVLSSLVFFNHFITAVVFDYDTWILSYIATNPEATDDVSVSNANSTLFFMSANMLIMFFFVRRDLFQSFWGNRWKKGKSVAMAIGAVFALKFVHGIYLTVIKYFPFSTDEETPGSLLTINESIISINRYYSPALGFLAVAVIAPVYEEIFFRGVVFSGVRKHMNFVWANVIQAALFATIHWDIQNLPFYFGFGLLAGYYRNQSGSLAPGIIFHIINNLLAFFAIVMTWQLRQAL